MPTLLSRLSVRLRVTLAFTAVMAVVLAATGLFLYVRLGVTVRDTRDRGLVSRADDLAALIARSSPHLGGRGGGVLAARSRDLAQILDARGRVVDYASDLARRPLLSRAERLRLGPRPLLTSHATPRVDGDGIRLYARTATDGARRYVVVAAAALEPDEDAHHDLGGLLLLGGPGALVLAALAGYGAIAAALRPVEAMRRRADAVSAGGSERLPVPTSDDELQRLGTTLNAMLDRLDEAYAHERRFVADASHELRTPLAILKGELELALRDARDAAAFRAAIESAAEETDRLVALAEDLLVVARADQGQLRPRIDDVDARAVVEAVTQRFARRAADAGVALDVGGSAVTLRADEQLLERALGNLVDNAVRHAHRRVTVATQPGAIVVRDDGDGFPDGFLHVAFERFTRADAARGRGGTGLGLAIVAAIAAAHGGEVTAHNSPDGGAEIRLTLG